MKTLTEFSTLMIRRAIAAQTANAGAEGDALKEAVATALGIPAERAERLLEAVEIVGDRVDAVRLVRVFQGETAPVGAVSKGEFHYVVDAIVKPQPKRQERSDRDERPRRGADRDKPRGLGALKALSSKGEKSESSEEKDDRPGRGEMPRAGVGWQLTSAPREFRGGKGGAGGKGGPRGKRPGGPRPPRLGPDGQPLPPRGPRPDRGPRGPRNDRGAQGGPGGPGNNGGGGGAPRPPRERKPIGPDANGMGPDGKPWDPERRAKRDAERATRQANTGAPAVEAAPKAE